MQQRQPLRSELGTEPTHPRDVAARPIEAGDKAVFTRVIVAREHNRDCTGRRLGRERRIVAAGCSDHGHLTLNEFGRQRRQSIRPPLRPAIFDRDVLAFDIAGLIQALAERGHHRNPRLRRLPVQKSNHRH